MQTSYRFSAPGRTEISGNHTDHQHGCVLAAAVDLETTAEVTLRPDSIIRVASEGYAPVEIDLNDLSVHAEEKNTTAALVRGVAAAFAQRGCKLHGFDAAVRSTVLPGSGLSSSAAFEVLIGTICNELFFDKKCSAIEIAQIGQYAENVYFGKPCGLMDQMASSVGGLVFIDFADPAHPAVRQAAFDFAHCGYTLCTLMHFGEYELSPSLISLSPLPSAHPEAFQRLLVRSSRWCYPSFNLPKGRSLGFASTPSDYTPCSDSLSLRLQI